MTMTPAQVLAAAADELETNGWTRGRYRDPIEGCHCAVGAMVEVIKRELPIKDTVMVHSSSPGSLSRKGERLLDDAAVELTDYLGLERELGDTLPTGVITVWNDKHDELSGGPVVIAELRAAAVA